MDPEAASTQDFVRLRLLRALVVVVALAHAAQLVLVWGDDEVGPRAVAGVGLALAFAAVLVVTSLHRHLGVTARQVGELRAELKAGEDRLQALLRHAVDVVLLVDPSGTVSYASTSVRSVFQVNAEELIGRPLQAVFGPETPAVAEQLRQVASHPGLVASVEVGLERPGGRSRRVEVRVSNLLHDVAVGGFVIHVADVTERRRHERELAYHAGHDALTGLPNRSQLPDALGAAWADAVRAEQSFAVLFADLDLFKQVNDEYGHEIGDEVLRICAERIREAIRNGDVALRFGGDEFVVVCPRADRAAAEGVARRIWDALHQPIGTSAGIARIGVSVGIAIGPHGFADPDELLRQADAAMYSMKSARRR